MRIGRRVAVVVTGLVVAGIVTSCQLPTVFTVDSVVDAPDASVGDGVCASASDGCTLRAAVQEANSRSGVVEIRLGNAEHYVLSVAGVKEDLSATGDLDVSGALTIVGRGSTIDAAGIDRVVHVLPGGHLKLGDATVTGGLAEFGGGLRVDQGASAEVSRSTITANVANGFQRCWKDLIGFGLGGCSWVDTGVGNLVYEHIGTGGGAGIWNAGTLSVWGSTISSNEVPEDPSVVGCWIFIHAGICDLHEGGGILNYGDAHLVNVTVSGNSVHTGFGGAISSEAGTMDLVFVAITGNTADRPTSWDNPGPGWPLHWPSQGTSVVGVPALAGTVVDGDAPLCSVSLSASSLGYNAASDDSCFSGGTDRSSTPSGLGPLAANGGPTLTHLPLTGSALIDAIPADASPCTGVLRIDQRDAARPAGQPCTIGSVEP